MPQDNMDIVVAKDICQSMTRKGKRCNQTTVPGYPFCINHIKSGIVSTQHDRYSGAMPFTVKPHYDHQLEDGNPKDLTEELAQARGWLRWYLEKLQKNQGQEAVVTADMGIVISLLEKISNLAEKHAKINPERVLTVPDVTNIITRIIDVIIENVPQEQAAMREKIVDGIHKAMSDLLVTAETQQIGSELDPNV